MLRPLDDGVLKENLRLDDQSKEVDFLFCVAVFPKTKRNRKMFSVFLSSYRNTRESLGELKKL